MCAWVSVRCSAQLAACAVSVCGGEWQVRDRERMVGLGAGVSWSGVGDGQWRVDGPDKCARASLLVVECK